MADPNIAMRRTESPATQSFHTVCIVKDYVRARRQSTREAFVPLHHPQGHGQADFGEARAVIGGVARKAHVFVFDLPHSDACYVRAYWAGPRLVCAPAGVVRRGGGSGPRMRRGGHLAGYGKSRCRRALTGVLRPRLVATPI